MEKPQGEVSYFKENLSNRPQREIKTHNVNKMVDAQERKMSYNGGGNNHDR